MNRVGFQRRVSSDGAVVDLSIDGRPLLDLVREAEHANATKDGQPDLAGKYESLPFDVLGSSLFVGEPPLHLTHLEAGNPPQRAPLLVCECGEAGCWPLMATIEVTDDRVTWRDFRQPYRSDWDYSSLGPFSFDRTEYLSALKAIASTSI